MSHTKLPWSINALASGRIVSEKRSIGSVGGFNDGTEKTYLENEANAAFIVKAVNSHYQLLEALKEIAEAKSGPAPYDSLELWELQDMAKKAIKQAEEE